jgi:uncharacterized protein (TIGR03790 family)
MVRVVAILLLILIPRTAAALAPDNVFVVANSESWASLAVADHYIHLRHIPDDNVLLLSFKLERTASGGDDKTSVERFREKLLAPVLAAIKERGLEKRIDCIAWSSDFPTAIDFSADLPASVTTRRRGFAVGSINGLTFLYEPVLAKDAAGYTSLQANHYYRATRDLGGGKFDVAAPTPFSREKQWDGRRHLLSIVLGVTSGRGNSVTEVLASLDRAAPADFTRPKGTFYYSVNDNVRSKTRQWGFDAAIAKLAEIGEKGQRDKDTFPRSKEDVMGAMLGLIHPKQEEAGSKTLPGAIVENLTSEGGVMNWGANQTPISSFIRNGAAGSSGTVIEPYAIQAKFPTPFLFYHYAAGSSLVEAFYESVQGPYQLLIVGDPLCRPFADAPKGAAAPVESKLRLGDPKILTAKPLPALHVTVPAGEAFVDGPVLRSGESTHVVEDMRRKPALQEAKVPVGGGYTIEAYFDADKDDLCQFQIFTDGQTKVTVDGVAIGESIEKRWTFLPVMLAKGKHKLEARGIAGPTRDLTIRFGGPGSREIGNRTRTFDADHPALHFAHMGVASPGTAPAKPQENAARER